MPKIFLIIGDTARVAEKSCIISNTLMSTKKKTSVFSAMDVTKTSVFFAIEKRSNSLPNFWIKTNVYHQYNIKSINTIGLVNIRECMKEHCGCKSNSNQQCSLIHSGNITISKKSNPTI